jgi:flagellar basal body-associated protein FliL
MSIKKWIAWIILLILLIGVLSIAAYVYVNRKTFDNYEEMKSGNKNVGLYVEELGEFYSLEERPQIIE